MCHQYHTPADLSGSVHGLMAVFRDGQYLDTLSAILLY